MGEVNTGTKGTTEKNGDIYELDESWFKERRERGVGEFTGIAFDLSASTIIRVGTGKGRKKRAAPLRWTRTEGTQKQHDIRCLGMECLQAGLESE